MARFRSVRVVALVLLAVVSVTPCVASAQDAWPWPLRGPIALEYGARYTDSQGRSCSHGGADIAAVPGTIVTACGPGEVTFAGLVPGGEGRQVRAVTVLTADGLRVTYLPLERASVARGDNVDAGDVIGELAPVGDASGSAAHLHLGVRRGERSLDPIAFLGELGAASQPTAPAMPAAPTAGARSVPAESAEVPAARSGSAGAAHASAGVASKPIGSAPSAAAAAAPAPAVSMLPTVRMPGLEALQRIAPVADFPQVRTAAISADVAKLRERLALAIRCLVLLGVCGACAWPAMRGVLAAQRDAVPAPVTSSRRSA